MLSNTQTRYGSVTKILHWLTAGLIVLLIPTGIIANDMAYDSSEALARKAWLFSIHKTLGVTLFFVALTRIAWAISQPKPGPLHAERRLETFAAATVHWLLYASLVVVPLSGWIHHAATEGFAPIWWPFGQNLPFIPENDRLAHTFASLHIIFERVLIISLLLHIAGALKHHFIDRDATLRRMLRGHTQIVAKVGAHPRTRPALIAAGAAYLVALSAGAALGLFAHDDSRPAVPSLAAVETGWAVQEGTLGLSVEQLGSPVAGVFEDWTAAIQFAEVADAQGRHGEVEVTVAVGSLSLGSVTDQALNADFLAAQAFPTAVFRAPILSQEDGSYLAEGELTLKGVTVPVSLPFTLEIDGDVARMQGQTSLNRTNFNVGESYPDEQSVGFGVDLNVELTAERVSD